MSPSRSQPCPWSVRACAITLCASLCLALVACTAGALRHSEWQRDASQQPTTVLLIKPDVELSELTAGGLQEPDAAWTVAGLANVEQALADFLGERSTVLVPYQPPNDVSEWRLHDQLLKLHRTVGDTILAHKYDLARALPTKKNAFDWSLGPVTQTLAEAYGADYALFVFLRDSYASAGRVLLMAAVALLFWQPISGGAQAGFASLVKLQSGDVVWFNFLQRSTGDLREPVPARETVNRLLADFPL